MSIQEELRNFPSNNGDSQMPLPLQISTLKSQVQVLTNQVNTYSRFLDLIIQYLPELDKCLTDSNQKGILSAFYRDFLDFYQNNRPPESPNQSNQTSSQVKDGLPTEEFLK